MYLDTLTKRIASSVYPNAPETYAVPETRIKAEAVRVVDSLLKSLAKFTEGLQGGSVQRSIMEAHDFLKKYGHSASKKKAAGNVDTGYAIKTSVNDISQALNIVKGMLSNPQVGQMAQKLQALLGQALQTLQRKAM